MQKKFCKSKITLSLIVTLLSLLFMIVLIPNVTACNNEDKTVSVISSEFSVEMAKDAIGREIGYCPYLTIVVKNNTSEAVGVYASAKFTYPNGAIYEGRAHFGQTMKPGEEATFVISGPQTSRSMSGFSAGEPILKVTPEEE